jgi:hypothetical protein
MTEEKRERLIKHKIYIVRGVGCAALSGQGIKLVVLHANADAIRFQMMLTESCTNGIDD